jgi:hypothetical protein
MFSRKNRSLAGASPADVPDIPDLARRVAGEFATADGVVGVTLGGSAASGTADSFSDIDLGLYYHSSFPPSIDALNAIAERIDDRHLATAVTKPGEWGPWINGGAWLVVEGTRVDILFRDLQRVQTCIDDCRAGRVSWFYQPGHPHAFSNAHYLAELHHGRILVDAAGVLSALKAEVLEYPPAMRREIVRHCLFETEFSLEIAAKSAGRGDATYVAGCLFRASICMVHVLFALNGTYLMNEKGAVVRAGALPLSPPAFADAVHSVMANAGASPTELSASITRLREQLDAVRSICAGLEP